MLELQNLILELQDLLLQLRNQIFELNKSHFKIPKSNLETPFLLLGKGWENFEPDYMEHNMVDCIVEDEWGGENVDWDEEIVPSWADSLSQNIFESVTLEIGNPIDDGYNYIKEVHYNDELKKYWDMPCESVCYTKL